eukprot:2013529-Prymnesium_polylepis.1
MAAGSRSASASETRTCRARRPRAGVRGKGAQPAVKVAHRTGRASRQLRGSGLGARQEGVEPGPWRWLRVRQEEWSAHHEAVPVEDGLVGQLHVISDQHRDAAGDDRVVQPARRGRVAARREAKLGVAQRGEVAAGRFRRVGRGRVRVGRFLGSTHRAVGPVAARGRGRGRGRGARASGGERRCSPF